MTIVSLFLSARGRIGRLAYLLGVVSVSVVQGLVLAMLVASGGGGPAAIVFGILLVAMGYPHWMLSIKRAHDLDKSGWWLAGCVFLLPVVGAGLVGAAMAAAAGHNTALSLLLSLASLPFSLASLWICIKLFFFSGSAGGNTFGPPSNLLRHALNDAIDVPSAAVLTAARTQAISPAPVLAPRAQASSARPVRGTAASGGGNTRPAGFGRRGLNPA